MHPVLCVGALFSCSHMCRAEDFRGCVADQVAHFIFGGNAGKTDGFGSSEKISMTSPVISKSEAEDFRSMKGGSGEKIAMTSPVGTDMQGGKCAALLWPML